MIISGPWKSARQRARVYGRSAEILRLADVVQVDSVVDVGRQGPAGGRLEEDDWNLRVDRSGRLEDVQLELTGVPADRAVLHVVAAVEGNRRFVAARRRGPSRA